MENGKKKSLQNSFVQKLKLWTLKWVFKQPKDQNIK